MRRLVGPLALAAACSAPRPPGIPPVEAGLENPAHTEGDDAAPRRSERIDAVMEQWASEDTPGCAVGVIQDQRLIHAEGYGMADLEHAVPITPDTVFDIGSVSKQFTATAVLLAAAEGELRLDDDVRTHVPELPELGTTPTLRHLVHHTGGLRDYGMLLTLIGVRPDGIATAAQTLDLVARQRGVDFAPGADFAYSNTGYFLLAQAVERATAQSLATFLHAKVFEPLGMTRTQVLDDRGRIVPGRAIGYSPEGDRWRIEMSGWEQTGPGGVMSTVVDLARWDANFYEPTVGGRPLVDGLQTRGTLSDGTSLDYAAGLFHGHYRGQPTVWHAGGWAGYRAQFERFVEQETSIIVLCNAATARPDLLAHEIADIVLEDDLGEADTDANAVFPTPQPPVELSEAQLDAWVATYREVSTGEIMAIERNGQALEAITRTQHLPLVPTSPRSFRLDPDPVVFELGGAAPRRTLVLSGPMFEERFVETQLREPSPEELAVLAGRYRSDELGTDWVLSVSGRTLVATGPAFEGPAVLVTAVQDEYSTEALGGTLRFIRSKRGEVTGFMLDLNHMRDIRFDRVP